MAYPQSPWILQGYAILCAHLIDTQRVRSLIPSELKIISVLPGKTVGGICLCYYGTGSVMEYSELIVVPAFVGYQGKIGSWISHIYVDNPDSVAGGREIWGLPKELAQFTWEKGAHVTVRQGNRILCSLKYNRPTLVWRQWLSGSSFSTMNSDLLSFSFEIESRLGFVGSRSEVPLESPFSVIGLAQPFLTVRCEQMSLKVDAPKVLGHQQKE